MAGLQNTLGAPIGWVPLSLRQRRRSRHRNSSEMGSVCRGRQLPADASVGEHICRGSSRYRKDRGAVGKRKDTRDGRDDDSYLSSSASPKLWDWSSVREKKQIWQEEEIDTKGKVDAGQSSSGRKYPKDHTGASPEDLRMPWDSRDDNNSSRYSIEAQKEIWSSSDSTVSRGRDWPRCRGRRRVCLERSWTRASSDRRQDGGGKGGGVQGQGRLLCHLWWEVRLFKYHLLLAHGGHIQVHLQPLHQV